MKLYTLSTGDLVYRYYKSIVILFEAPRKVLSTSTLNGGYHEELTSVFNHDCNPGAGMACTLRAPTYEAHMRLVADELGLTPETTSGIATAASMDNVAIRVSTYEQLTVTAIVTGGVEVNGGRVGDPATYYQPLDKVTLEKPGTINIILVIDADLPPGILARALVTCTEAKTAALQELMAGSNYSSGLATGSGTDSTIIVANPASPLYFESAGKHSKLGELIGKAVKEAVKEALFLQTQLSPAYQHSVLRRLKRYGITEERLWKTYLERGNTAVKAQFLDCLYSFDQDSYLVTYTSLYIHLLDQEAWGLLSSSEVQIAGIELIQCVCEHYELEGFRVTIDMNQLIAWEILLLTLLEKKFQK
ncbi:adenosylcobinamide amidohydrolase [Pelosinus sp. sgz500959]|uniref:adenosylcobinamide amidohydrolase n=1 Tax=Pelosinus sp. sgz500959 TaxID=3242472 RepID=UPI00366DC88C